MGITIGLRDERSRRGYSLMEGVPGERSGGLLTEAADSTLSAHGSHPR